MTREIWTLNLCIYKLCSAFTHTGTHMHRHKHVQAHTCTQPPSLDVVFRVALSLCYCSVPSFWMKISGEAWCRMTMTSASGVDFPLEGSSTWIYYCSIRPTWAGLLWWATGENISIAYSSHPPSFSKPIGGRQRRDFWLNGFWGDRTSMDLRSSLDMPKYRCFFKGIVLGDCCSDIS